MKIQRLHLSNVRCFEDLDLDLGVSNRSRTVFLGNNGNGKSTILQCVALLTCGSSSLGELIDNPDDWVKNKKESCRITGVFSSEKEEKEITLEIHRGDNLEQLISRNKEDISFVDERLKDLMIIGYGVSRRSGSSDAFLKRGYSRNPRTNRVATLFDQDVSLYPFEAWITSMHYEQGEQAFQVISKVLNKLLPGTELSTIEKETKEIIFKNKDGELNFRQLSDGYQVTASWLGDLLLKLSGDFESEIHPTEIPFTLLIDEIELHLHPDWQRKILDSISDSFPKAQIIATTHSPFVAQQTRQGELCSLIRNGSKVTLHGYAADPRKLPISELLVSDIFGLPTDESIELSTKKSRLRTLTAKKSLRPKEKAELNNIEEELLNRSASFKTDLTDKQWELYKALKKRNKEKS